MQLTTLWCASRILIHLWFAHRVVNSQKYFFVKSHYWIAFKQLLKRLKCQCKLILRKIILYLFIMLNCIFQFHFYKSLFYKTTKVFPSLILSFGVLEDNTELLYYFCCGCWLMMTHRDSNENILLDQLVVWIFLFPKHLPLASVPWNSCHYPHWELREAPGHHLASKWLDASSSLSFHTSSLHYHINWCSL